MRKTSAILSALMTLGLGVLCIILKASVIDVAITVLGIVFLVVGIIDLIGKNIVAGVIKTALGVAVLWFGLGDLIEKIGFVILGIVLLIYGVLELIKRIVALVKKHSKRVWAKVIGIIEAALWIVGAIFLITNTGTAVEWVVIAVGVLFIVDGVLGLVGAIASKN